MVTRLEALGTHNVGNSCVERALDARTEADVLHPTALFADEVMVVLGEVLGELVVRMIRAVHQSAHHPGLLEHREIPVRRTLRE